MGFAATTDLVDAVAQQLDASADQPAIGLELRLARSAHADTAFLPLEVGPAADQPRGKVLELRQLDLQLAFRALGPLRENVEDQAGAIDDATIEFALEIALLRTGQRVVEDDEIRAGGRTQRRHFGHFATPGKKRRIGLLAAGSNDTRDIRPRARRQRLELRQPFGGFAVAEIELDQEGPITTAWAIKHRC